MTLRCGAETPPTQDAGPSPTPLSSGQQRLWFLHKLHGSSREYHVPDAFRLRGTLDVAALRRALDTVVRRHEVLRARFLAPSGVPVQVIQDLAPVECPIDDLRSLPEPGRRVADALQAEWERPFDLATGPLLRARLLRLADDEHVLLVTTHHIASDGWSQTVLRRELGALYNAFHAGLGDPLPPPPVQYADYVRWQRDRTDSGAVDGELDYWQRRLAGLADSVAIPADRPRRVAPAQPVRMHRTVVEPALLTRLRDLRRGHGTTLYMTLLAAFGVLLGRHTGRPDIAVGTPVAGRNRIEWERLVGFLVNTVIIRLDVRPELRFADLLAGVWRAAVEAFEHQQVPFERVVEELSPQRRLDRTPLVQVLFAHQMVTARPMRLNGLDVAAVEQTHSAPRFELELHAWEQPDRLTLYWVFDEQRFDRERIERLADDYLRLIELFSADPARNLHDTGLPPLVSAPGAGAAPSPAAAPTAALGSGTAAVAPGPAVAGETSLEERLILPIFAEVLGLPEVDRHDSFFVLGGHSLMAMRVIAKIYELTGVELAVRDIFEAPTAAQLALRVRR